jgi:hypothetical protein
MISGGINQGLAHAGSLKNRYCSTLFEKVGQLLKTARGFFWCGKLRGAILAILEAIIGLWSAFDFSKM